MSIWTGCEHHLSDQELAPTHDKLCVFCLSARIRELEAENEQLMSLCQRWSEHCTGRHGSQTQCVEILSAECKEQSPHAWGLAPTSETRMGAGQVRAFDLYHLEPQSETFDEPSGMEIAQREADEAAGDADPRDRVQGAK